jgi:hypothetical protein
VHRAGPEPAGSAPCARDGRQAVPAWCLVVRTTRLRPCQSTCPGLVVVCRASQVVTMLAAVAAFGYSPFKL